MEGQLPKTFRPVGWFLKIFNCFDIQAYNTRSNSKKPRGRPRQRWADDIKYMCASLLDCDIRAATSRAELSNAFDTEGIKGREEEENIEKWLVSLPVLREKQRPSARDVQESRRSRHTSLRPD